ncbi:hypothetical protein GGH95_001395 [Coemansia sp. RSA 1836]|nr:hypothetical protein GGH95_001395 [Coemansia sp. RSA 1836]
MLSIMRRCWQPLLLLLVLVAAAASATPTPSSHSLESATVTSKASASPEVEDSAESAQAMDRMLSTLVQHAFGPQHEDHADLYYRTRFFTARLTARMQYIVQQSPQDAAAPGAKVLVDDKLMELTQAEANELNSIRTDMWLASRKLYQSWGCLSYDLTLCNGESTKAGGPKPSKHEKAAMLSWEKRLSAPFAARKRLPREEAEEIRSLVQGIQSALLS